MLAAEAAAEDALVRFDLETRSRLSEGVKRLSQGGVEAILLDLSLPDGQGLRSVAAVREQAPHVPIVVLTGRAGELLVERDPSGNDIAAGLRELKPSARGDNLVLTLDSAMQYETERALSDAIVSSKAKGGMAVVSDPPTTCQLESR